MYSACVLIEYVLLHVYTSTCTYRYMYNQTKINCIHFNIFGKLCTFFLYIYFTGKCIIVTGSEDTRVQISEIRCILLSHQNMTTILITSVHSHNFYLHLIEKFISCWYIHTTHTFSICSSESLNAIFLTLIVY